MAEIDILLLEDNHGDIHLIKRTFEDRSLPGELHTVKTGEAALDWLYQRDEFAGAPRPDLLLLDLNLPDTSGQDVLAEIKSHPDLQRLPVVILTGTQSETDLGEAYDAGANACLVKPIDPDEFGDLVERVTEFWASTVSLPPGPHHADQP